MNIVMNLQGLWQFRLDREKQGLKAHYEATDFNDTILLPATVSEAGKGTPHARTDTGHLTDPYEMEGYSWYRKTISLPMKDISELSGKHFELTLERTRISHVWVDGCYAGSFDSFVARHRYDLTGMIKTLNPCITIMISNTGYKVPGGHMTSPDTQTNWNGILGEISLTVREDVRLGTVEAVCRYEQKGILLKIPVQYDGLLPCPAKIQVQPVLCHLKDVYAVRDKIIPANGKYEDFVEWTPLPDEKELLEVTLQPGKNHFELFLDLSASPKLWDEEEPYVYRLHLSCKAFTETGRNADSSAMSDTSSGMTTDTADIWCGLRSFTAGRTHFLINGRKTFLRGKHEGMIFPMTGYAPMDVAGWLHVMKIARDYGINHYRFHTCCPPEAAFVAADLLGIYMQPEVSFWGTFNGPNDEGYDREAQDFLEAEGFRMLESFSNHPSYCMMSMGNELWGNASALNDLLEKYKAFRPDILFAQGSNNFFWTPDIQPCDDFFSGVRFTVDRQIRGSFAMCDKPLGHVQTAVPGTRFHYDEAIRPSRTALTPEIPADAGGESAVSEEQMIDIQYGTGVRQVRLSEVHSELIPEIPVISHEIGQYETYPDFREIQKYTGVLKARNLEEFRRRLEEKGMLDFALDFFRSSGALAAACYKDELETALRSSQLAGFQILDIQDFTGQGTALVGILNPFMENKGLITAAEWRRFCSDAVLQAEFDSYVIISGKLFEFGVSLSYFRKLPMLDDELVCYLKDSSGNVISHVSTFVTALAETKESAGDASTIGVHANGVHANGVHANGVYNIGEFALQLPEMDSPASLTLTVELKNLGIGNSYGLWIYQDTAKYEYESEESKSEESKSANEYSNSPVAQCLAHLPALAQTSRSCLLFLSDEENRASVEGTYCTDFWCYPMFRNISLSAGKETPVGTLGLLIRKAHRALSGFPCEMYTTPQWHSIINASRSTILDDTKIVPIVQTIDNFSRNHRLGMIYEIYLQDLDLGLLVCTSDLPKLVQEGHPEARCLYESLVSYLPELAEKRKNTNSVYAMTSGTFRKLLSQETTEPEYDL